jgi:hypothetical protein
VPPAVPRLGPSTINLLSRRLVHMCLGCGESSLTVYKGFNRWQGQIPLSSLQSKRFGRVGSQTAISLILVSSRPSMAVRSHSVAVITMRQLKVGVCGTPAGSVVHSTIMIHRAHRDRCNRNSPSHYSRLPFITFVYMAYIAILLACSYSSTKVVLTSLRREIDYEGQ